MADLARGRLVWVELRDPQGRDPKVRPAVVLTETADVRPDGTIRVAAVTGAVDEIPEGFAVPLPWERRGHPETKLTKPCAVACNWTCRVPVSAVQSVRGRVPDRRMAEVLAIVGRIPDDPPPAPPPRPDEQTDPGPSPQ